MKSEKARIHFLLALFGWACSLAAQTVGNFHSIRPAPQDQLIHIPPSHRFQVLAQAGDPLSDGSPLMDRFDFTAYYNLTREMGQGRLGLSHESNPGGLTFFDLRYSPLTQLWETSHIQAVNFAPLGNLAVPGTQTNCSGTLTPWGTLVTCEESYTGTDLTGDGYFDAGWCVEIDILSKNLMDYNGDGIPEKVTAIGRMKHENIAVTADSGTVYFGAEEPINGFLFKLVLQDKARLDSGSLYTLCFDSLGKGEWRRIPNNTVAERNMVLTAAYLEGAYNWERIEDVDIDAAGLIYFTSTIRGKVFRFQDMGDTVANFEIFINNQLYPVVVAGDTLWEEFSWPDNLAFDGNGDLWVTQDGGNYHVWVARHDHTQANPKLDVFMNTPAGCEPTGITFSPDYNFMFISLQHPWSGNVLQQADVTGDSFTWNRDPMIVIARSELLGTSSAGNLIPIRPGVHLVAHYPIPAFNTWILEISSEGTLDASLKILDMQGRVILQKETRLLPGVNLLEVEVGGLSAGIYPAVLRCGDGQIPLQLLIRS